jgi:hypothetical protein
LLHLSIKLASQNTLCLIDMKKICLAFIKETFSLKKTQFILLAFRSIVGPGYAIYLAKNRIRPIPFLAVKGFMRIILEGYGK